MSDAPTASGPGPLITGDELGRMARDEPCELIDGRIVSMNPTNPNHAYIEANIASHLQQFVRVRKLGRVMTGEVGIFTRHQPDRVRGADVAYISHEQYARRTKTRAFLDVAPELIVEVLSPEDRQSDVSRKVREYLGIGVRLVLVVDSSSETITTHRPGQTPQVFVCGDDQRNVVSCDDALPGYRLPVQVAFD